MKIPPKGNISNDMVMSFVMLIIIFSVLLGWFIATRYDNKPTGDVALTNQQVLDRAQQCYKQDMAIRLVYDDEWQVYAVKCVEGGFDGTGRKKK